MLSEKPWKIDGLLMLGLSLLVGIGFFSLIAEYMAQHGAKKLDDNSPVILILRTLALDGSILFSVFLFLRVERISWADAFGFKPNTIRRAMVWGAIVAVCFTPVGQGLNYLCGRGLELLHLTPAVEQAVETMQKSAPGFSRIYLIFFAVVIAPIAEETLFRGILYPTIKQYGFPRTALLGTSFLFAAVHMNLPAFLPLMLLGIVQVVLYEKTDNLFACISAHGLFNAFAIVWMYCFVPSSSVTHPPY